ncbi:hypothetical protein [Reyranella soli]|uniref:Lipoprotein n=1 Tax=Reyranella soli TaxID=1230389 RepID=A0A512NPY2_9HYPH|nr:hypothetical protein [Reyranella soli]GEP60977.1 hypothetical protein RSO01_81430 [Reyranella soli]
MRVRILATISLGLLSAACQGSYSQNAPGAAAPAYGNTYQSSSAACADYGFHAGTTSFNQCVAREQQARATGRVNRDYAATQLTADARSACSSYGLAGGTASYDRCVSREVDARTYRDGVAQPGPAYYTDQNGNRVDAQGYRVDANGYRIASQASPYYPSASPTYPGQPAPTYRMDQYNNRVDAEGYQVDSSGRRMPVQGLYDTPAPQVSSQAASRDEFGNRYDAQGNRVDASGRVIGTPQNRY